MHGRRRLRQRHCEPLVRKPTERSNPTSKYVRPCVKDAVWIVEYVTDTSPK